MFLPQTSLIPSTIALLDFFNKSFPDFFWYPYWYLGNPFNYLIGPVVLFASLLLKSIFGFTAEQSFWIIFALSFLVGSIALYLFCKKLGGTKLLGLIVAAINILLPFSYIMLNFQNGLSHISFFLLPLILYTFVNFLKKNSLFFDLLLIVLIALLLLIDISVIVPIIISLISLILILEKQQFWIKSILKTILILLASFFFSTTWYTFGFWATLIFNPSFGGQPLINLLKLIFDLSLRVIPIIVAVWVVKMSHIKLNKLALFGLLFISSFGFLTFLRLIADPDFILDWISYAQELQFGISFLAVGVLSGVRFKQKLALGGLICLVAVLGWIKFFNLINDSASKDFKANVLNLIGNNVDGNFFFSGSNVFFINQYKDLMQLRGGNDASSIHPTWAMASYQLREGKDKKVSENWLKALGVNNLLVHKLGSSDYFLDFKNPKKFENLRLIGNSNSDYLYQLRSNSVGRVTDASIFNVDALKNGEDSLSLKDYVKALGQNIQVHRKNNEIVLDKIPAKSKIISLAITFHPNWSISDPSIKLKKDALGNTLLVKESGFDEKVTIEYNPSLFSHVFPTLFFTITLYLILEFNLIAKFIFRKISIDENF